MCYTGKCPYEDMNGECTAHGIENPCEEARKEIEEKMNRRIALTKRKDGYLISTVRSLDNWYGKYETAFWYEGSDNIRILKGYETKKQSIEGHTYFCNISTEELEQYEVIG